MMSLFMCCNRDGLDDEINLGDPGANYLPMDHESPTRLAARLKDKRIRPNHLHKGKAGKDKRKLREKRRSTGVVHLQQPSTEVYTLIPLFLVYCKSFDVAGWNTVGKQRFNENLFYRLLRVFDFHTRLMFKLFGHKL